MKMKMMKKMGERKRRRGDGRRRLRSGGERRCGGMREQPKFGCQIFGTACSAVDLSWDTFFGWTRGVMSGSGGERSATAKISHGADVFLCAA